MTADKETTTLVLLLILLGILEDNSGRKRAGGWGRAQRWIKINTSLSTKKIRRSCNSSRTQLTELADQLLTRDDLTLKKTHQYTNCNFRLTFMKYLFPIKLSWICINTFKSYIHSRFWQIRHPSFGLALLYKTRPVVSYLPLSIRL